MLELLPAGVVDVTDPGRLHAELWADSVLKVVSCWLPFLLSTIVVGRDLLGSSSQCFPLDRLHGTVQCENGTILSDGNSSTFSEISVYTRQISEFVNVYCAGQESFCANTKFSYHQFAMMLAIQAALLYAPLLIWNVTVGREVICNVRFIACDMVVLYDRFRKPKDGQTGGGRGNEHVNTQVDSQDAGIGQKVGHVSPPHTQLKGPYAQEELVYAYKTWRKTRVVYTCYLFKQASSGIVAVALIVAYALHQPISVESIREKFQCSVENKFLVTCTVPAAKVHLFVWGANMFLLSVSVILTITHIILLHALAKDQPFAEIGIKNKKKDDKKKDETMQGKNPAQETRRGRGRNDDQPVIETGSNDDEDTSYHSAQSQIIIDGQKQHGNTQNGTNQVTERPQKCLFPLNDSQMMYSFFKANIESVEKYNYVKSLLNVAPKQQAKQRSTT
ncbi:PREDICTED: uncharacterized protein LOC109471816 [Branchiostoma belcheri]|uniref:Uncharacterized protein LOC109471816 n=1 Tax=Branchiostoma belcheri TaxID=7741 RepID=A0A6P4YC63_BRABE|nr:PREDICTED: uncharacterized protein LOC109471816 [Branchiostoma belcheri]